MQIQYDAKLRISSGIYSNFQKHYCEIPQMVQLLSRCIPLIVGHMSSVYFPSKGMVTVMLMGLLISYCCSKGSVINASAAYIDFSSM